MRAQITHTLEVFRYACIHQAHGVSWDKQAIQRIEHTLKADPKLDRLHALVYQNALERQHIAWFSQAFQHTLKINSYRLIADVASKKNGIEQLAQLLKQTELNVMLLKGMAFNAYLYPNNSPRGSSDIDLLIQPFEKTQFCEVFKQIATKVEPKKADAFGETFEQTWQLNNTSKVYFDLHWHLAHPSLFNFDAAAIANRSIMHPEYQSPYIRLLSHEDHIVYIAIHVLKDCDFFHYGLIDCHELISQHNPNLALCFNIAETWGIKTGLYFLLMQSRQILQSPISEKLLIANQPSYIREALCRFAINKVLVKPSELKTTLHRIKQFIAVMMFSDNLLRALHHYLFYIKRSIFR